MYQKSEQNSRDRRELRRLAGETAGLLAVFCAGRPFWKGMVYVMSRRCGKPRCRCLHGPPHQSLVLADRSTGRQRILPLPDRDRAWYEARTRSYRRFRQARARLVRIHQEMLAILRRLESRALADGQRNPPRRPAP